MPVPRFGKVTIRSEQLFNMETNDITNTYKNERGDNLDILNTQSETLI